MISFLMKFLKFDSVLWSEQIFSYDFLIEKILRECDFYDIENMTLIGYLKILLNFIEHSPNYDHDIIKIRTFLKKLFIIGDKYRAEDIFINKQSRKLVYEILTLITKYQKDDEIRNTIEYLCTVLSDFVF